MKHTHRERKIVKERKGREREKHKKRDYLNFPQMFSLSSSFFVLYFYFFRVSFSFLFIYLFVFSLLLLISGHILLLCYFSFLFFLSVFGRPRLFGVPETSSGPSNPEIHSLLTFMSLRSNSDERWATFHRVG